MVGTRGPRKDGRCMWREREREQANMSDERQDKNFHGIEIWAGGSWLGSGDDGPGTMMVRTPSCISAMTLSTVVSLGTAMVR